MATRKKTTRKKATRKKTTKRTPRKKTAKQNAAKLLKAADRELTALAKRIDKQIDRMGKEMRKAERQAAREAAKKLRGARSKLDKLQVKGSGDLNKFLRQSKKDLSKTLEKLERSVKPKPARKKTGATTMGAAKTGAPAKNKATRKKKSA
jgi:hypothetical protein